VLFLQRRAGVPKRLHLFLYVQQRHVHRRGYAQIEGDNTGALELQHPIEALIDILKERATFLRSKGDDIGASELEQRIKALQA
jgi:hypothetical protein